MSYVVTAPYITLRVGNQLGQQILSGFYEGGVLPEDVNQDDVDKHVRKGMIAEQGTPEADAATPYGKPVRFDEGGMPMSADAVVAADSKRTERSPRPGPRAEGKPRAAEAKA